MGDTVLGCRTHFAEYNYKVMLVLRSSPEQSDVHVARMVCCSIHQYTVYMFCIHVFSFLLLKFFQKFGQI